MRNIIVLGIFLFFSSAGFGQESPYRRVDSVMRTFDKKVKNVEGLKDVFYFIYQNFYPDSLRLRACVVWIAENIAYDVKGWQTENPNSGDINHVLRYKKGVCAGYALLLKQLCDMFRIECEVVSGNARTFDRDICMSGSRLRSNHAWNMVKINGEWRLIDPTWLTGHVTGEEEDPKTRFQKEFNEIYYFTPPAKFILNHYPEQKKHQLLSPVMNESKFKNAPLFHWAFLKDSIAEVIPSEPLIKGVVGDTIIFKFRTNSFYSRMAAWSTTQKKATFDSTATYDNGWIEFRYPIKVGGDYYLHIGYERGYHVRPLLSYKMQIRENRDRL